MKVELILFLYDAFLRGEVVSRREFCLRYSVSERTFYRYLHEISLFLREYRPSCVLDVLEPQGKYYIKCDQSCQRAELVGRSFY